MITITFITSNKKKVQSAQAILNKFGIKVLQKMLDVPEIQNKDIRKIAEYSAKFAAEKLKKAIIKSDVGFEIEALNGFPGPFSKYINEWLSPQKILKIIEDENNRNAKFVDVITYCKPNNNPVSFLAITKGKITRNPAGENGWGIDKIFIPDGFNETIACLPDNERVKVWNTSHWDKLAQYLIKEK